MRINKKMASSYAKHIHYEVTYFMYVIVMSGRIEIYFSSLDSDRGMQYTITGLLYHDIMDIQETRH